MFSGGGRDSNRERYFSWAALAKVLKYFHDVKTTLKVTWATGTFPLFTVTQISLHIQGFGASEHNQESDFPTFVEMKMKPMKYEMKTRMNVQFGS